MKNAEWLSKKMDINLKLEWIVLNINNKLFSNFDEKDNFKDLKQELEKILRFWVSKFSKIKDEKEFEEFMLWFEKILNNIEIEKLYNTTTLSKEWLKEFNKLSLLMKFFYISTPLRTNKNFKFIKWWTCYNWVLFFNDLFDTFDNWKKVEKEMLIFDDKFNHSIFKISFWNKWYIIDPYSKWKWLLTEIKKWNKVYLSALSWKLLYWTIETENPLKINYADNNLKINSFKNKNEFIENMKDMKQNILNIKTYIEWKSLHLMIDLLWDDIMINFNWEQFMRKKEFFMIDVVWLYMEGNPTKLNILLALLWFDKNNLNKDILNKLIIISDKINKNTLFKRLWIDEDMKIFS